MRVAKRCGICSRIGQRGKASANLLVFVSRYGIISCVDVKSAVRGRGTAKREPSTLEIRQCRYCKGKFEVDPKFPHKMFCCESHRKLYWRYGSQSIGKVAQRIERDMHKMVEAAVKPLREQTAPIADLKFQVEILEGAIKTTGLLLRELNQRVEALERADVTQRAIERVLRGGGAAA